MGVTGNCSICLKDYGNDAVLAHCGHFFHAPCIDRWLSTVLSCPLCRCPLMKKQIVWKLYTGGSDDGLQQNSSISHEASSSEVLQQNSSISHEASSSEVLQRNYGFRRDVWGHRKPKRPISSFFFFLKENRHLLTIPGATSQDVAKMGGIVWNELTDAEKTRWNEMAAEDRRRYFRQMAEYRAQLRYSW